VRRTLVLVAFVAIAAALVAVVEPPRRLAGRERARGPRVFRGSPRAVERLEIDVGGRHLAAERGPDGAWRIENAPVSAMLADGLDSLAHELVTLRAVDAFRTASLAALGLDPPAGTIVLTTSHGVQRLALGALNTGGSTVYARRDDHARVLQVGVYVVDLVRRVFGARDAEGRAARVGAYCPEIG
jgi:hypothetical protein